MLPPFARGGQGGVGASGLPSTQVRNVWITFPVSRAINSRIIIQREIHVGDFQLARVGEVTQTTHPQIAQIFTDSENECRCVRVRNLRNPENLWIKVCP